MVLHLLHINTFLSFEPLQLLSPPFSFLLSLGTALLATKSTFDSDPFSNEYVVMRIPCPAGLRVGTDIVACRRLLNPDTPDQGRFFGLMNRILTAAEHRDLVKKFPFCRRLETQLPADRQSLARWFAGRLAAKEAAKKAWGANILSWKDLTVEISAFEGPIILCNPFKDPKKPEQEASLSISHDGDYATATVIAAPLDAALVTELKRRKYEAEAKVGPARRIAGSQYLNRASRSIFLDGEGLL